MRKSILIVGMAAAVALCGCQNTVNTTENAQKSMELTPVSEARFVTDSILRDRLVLKLVNASRTEDGFMRAQLAVENARTGFWSEFWSGLTGENPYKIRYKFIWFNDRGMAVNNTVLADWQDAEIIPGETLYLQSVAPDKSCNDFKISLKAAD